MTSEGVVGAAVLAGGLADRDQWQAAGHCSIEKALEVVGTRSALLVMREAFYGTRRFDDFAARVGVTDAVAAARLRDLVAAGLLERRPYREPGQRTRHEYVLTDAGRDLLPVAVALMRWGDRHTADLPGGALRLSHQDCGADVDVTVRCTAGHEVALEQLRVTPRRRV